MLGEIDYLLGDHARARVTLKKAIERCTEVGDIMGRAQCLILLALIEEAMGAFKKGSGTARATPARSSTASATGSASRSATWPWATPTTAPSTSPSARARALAARASFREVQNPRGEAACERLLAMIALDADDFDAADAHARVAFKIYERLQDPWGELESRLLLAQVALARGDPRAEGAGRGLRRA